ncbi:MAG: SLC13 family permease [Marmoricola sp.]
MSVHDALADVEWETLASFMGLFIMVGALVRSGLIGSLADSLGPSLLDNFPGGVVVLLLVSMMLSGLIDNIPYVATLAPVVAQLARHQPAGHGDVLWWALALGADLGGNLTAVGASADVVVLGLARRYDNPISFWQFTRYGVVVTLASAALAVPYLLLRYF